MTHICISNLTIIGSDNGLSPGRRQAIIWANVGIMLIGPLGTNCSEILFGIQTFPFKKMHLKMSFAKWRSYCFGLNVLIPDPDGEVEHIHNLMNSTLIDPKISSKSTDTFSNNVADRQHNDVTIWKHFPRYCPFVRGIHRSPVDTPHKGTVARTFDVSLLSVWTNCWTNTRLSVIRDVMAVFWRHRNKIHEETPDNAQL